MNSVEVQGISMADVIIIQSIARLLMAQEKQDAWHLPQVILLQEKAKVYFYIHVKIFQQIFQLTFDCSKSTIETLEKGVKYAQS